MDTYDKGTTIQWRKDSLKKIVLEQLAIHMQNKNVSESIPDNKKGFKRDQWPQCKNYITSRRK